MIAFLRSEAFKNSLGRAALVFLVGLNFVRVWEWRTLLLLVLYTLAFWRMK